MSTLMRDTESVSMSALSIALISPNAAHRRTIIQALTGSQAGVVRELTSYPEIDDLAETVADREIVIIDLEPDPERALDVVETICSDNAAVTVMVYSPKADPEMLVRCMRAGAREFLSDPVLPGTLAEALVRASVRQDEPRRHKKTTGKLLVCVSAKGGSGVTTIASNFAMALTKTGGKKVALIDLDLYLGDAALTLGLTTKFSMLDALSQADRLDSELLKVLLAKHDSGLSVLAAPDAIPSSLPSKNAIEKLIRVLREDFDYVVIDAGSNPGEICGALFETAATVYLVVQAGIADLRNANRFVSRYFGDPHSSKLEIVLNRSGSRSLEIDESAIRKAVLQDVSWKVPNDFPSARRAQNTGVPMALEDTAIARVFGQMARDAAGQVAAPERKKKFGLF